jgi:hypothetical protein
VLDSDVRVSACARVCSSVAVCCPVSSLTAEMRLVGLDWLNDEHICWLCGIIQIERVWKDSSPIRNPRIVNICPSLSRGNGYLTVYKTYELESLAISVWAVMCHFCSCKFCLTFHYLCTSTLRTLGIKEVQCHFFIHISNWLYSPCRFLPVMIS